jgi:hypothetical protein
VPNGQITAAADGGTNREDESESGGFHASIRCPTTSLSYSRRGAKARRSEGAANVQKGPKVERAAAVG